MIITFKTFYLDKNPLTRIFKNQISSLFINFNNVEDSPPRRPTYFIIFAKILTIFTNLRCLKFNPSAPKFDAVSFYSTDKTAIYSNLLELHISVEEIQDCFRLLDGRSGQLRVLYVTVNKVLYWLREVEYEVGCFYEYFVCLNVPIFVLIFSKSCYQTYEFFPCTARRRYMILINQLCHFCVE